MGTIEEIVKLSRETGPRPRDVSPTTSQTFSGRRGALVENRGAEWIAGLREVPVDIEALTERRIIGGHDADATDAAYKMLRTRAIQRMRQNDWKVIMVTSPEQGDGKSLTAVNLAISLAREVTLSVVLVDLDLRRPGVSRYLGIDPQVGVADFLEGKAELEDVYCRPRGFDRLALMPNLTRHTHSSELLSSPKMADMMVSTLSGGADGRVVICDLPPLLAADDALAFSPLIDAVLLVVSEGVTSREKVARAWELIDGLDVLGVVLNRSRESNPTTYSY